MTDESIELGGSIKLVGFSNLEPPELIITKKMVGSYARRFSERVDDFQELSISMKKVHKTVKSEKYEITSNIISGSKNYSSNVTDFNLFVAIDSSLKKLEGQIK
ncbi:hypothetical protein JW868_00770 [Candidatus Woesearchaeota archaeon]|nr:hypothetical protein [Candidatus Woesearchaeota archaeon]